MRLRWESSARYYEAILQRDLFGDLVLTTARGGLRNRLGALRHLALASEELVLKELMALHKIRLKRGYRLMLSTGLPPSALSGFEISPGA
jgi:hypothetical protein